MFIYLVRHGQTPDNSAKRHQTAETPLSAEGEIQAGKVAERLSRIKLNEIWVSPMKRAQQTAAFINQYQKTTLKTVEELREIKRASVFEGKLHNDPTIDSIKHHLLENHPDPYHKFEDSDSLAEIVERAQVLLKMIEKKATEVPDDYALGIVSHGTFLTIFFGVLLLDDLATPVLAQKMLSRLRMENTGISIASLTDKWRIMTFSDFAHL